MTLTIYDLGPLNTLTLQVEELGLALDVLMRTRELQMPQMPKTPRRL